MRKLIIIGAMLFVLAAIPLVGADSDTITVTLTPGGSADVYVNQTAWNGGMAAIGANASTTTTWGKVQNNGTVGVNVQVKATNSSAWTLAGTAAHNAFKLEILGDNAVTLTIADQTFENPLEATGQSGASEPFGLKVTMPTSSSTNTAQTSTITFTSTVN